MHSKLRDLKITTTVFVHNSLGQDFEQSFPRQCFCSMQYWLRSVSQLHSCYLGWEIRSKKSLFTCLAALCSSVWTFFLYVAKVGFFMVISVYADFLCGISFPREITTSSEGRHCRPKAQSQKLYTVTSVALHQPKQLIVPAQTDAEGK